MAINKTVGIGGDYSTWASAWNDLCLAPLADDYTFTQISDVYVGNWSTTASTPQLSGNGYTITFQCLSADSHKGDPTAGYKSYISVANTGICILGNGLTTSGNTVTVICKGLNISATTPGIGTGISVKAIALSGTKYENIIVQNAYRGLLFPNRTNSYIDILNCKVFECTDIGIGSPTAFVGTPDYTKLNRRIENCTVFHCTHNLYLAYDDYWAMPCRLVNVLSISGTSTNYSGLTTSYMSANDFYNCCTSDIGSLSGVPVSANTVTINLTAVNNQFESVISTNSNFLKAKAGTLISDSGTTSLLVPNHSYSIEGRPVPNNFGTISIGASQAQIYISGNQLNFVQNSNLFVVVADTKPTWNIYYTWNFGDGTISASSATTFSAVDYNYTSRGTYNIIAEVDILSSAGVLLSADNATKSISINPLPEIAFVGVPELSGAIDFYDVQGGYYITNTVVSADWNFGDGQTSSTTDLDVTLEHTYYTLGDRTVSISAYDISGNVGVDTVVFTVLGGANCQAKEDYITLCGPDMLGRFGANKRINLVDYLPMYLKGGETEEFLVLFEEFLNNMYFGTDGWVTSSSAVPVIQDWSFSNSGTISAAVSQDFSYMISGVSAATEATDVEQIELSTPADASYIASSQKMSILEKINRLTELHDPSLIDLDYIQFFAANLGYNVNVSRDEVGVSGTTDTFGTTEFGGVCSAADINRYLRFVVENLPTWYKIKTTKNSIKVMLYSFGLVGDLIEYFTDNYKQSSEGGHWRTDYDGDLSEINNQWFPTPHFEIYVDFDSSSDVSFEISRRTKVIRAIESIRPINTVFRGLVGLVSRLFDLKVACFIRSTRYTVIESNGYSNGW